MALFHMLALVCNTWSRFVEQVFGAATLRPLFRHELDLMHVFRPLRLCTNDAALAVLLPGRATPPVMLDLAPLAQDPVQVAALAKQVTLKNAAQRLSTSPGRKP